MERGVKPLDGELFSTGRMKPDENTFYGGGASSLHVSGLTLSESVYPAGMCMPRHQHEPAYFCLVIKGGYRETLGLRSSVREAGPMALFYHPQGESHAVEFFNTSVQIFRIEMRNQWRNLIEEECRVPDEPVAFQGGSMSTLALRLYREYRQRDQWSRLAIEGLTLEIIAGHSRQSAKASGRKWLFHARDILTINFIQPPPLVELAGQVGVHPVHLAREFRRHYNCSIGDFCRKLRIERASRQIVSTDLPISEIALSLGFYDQSHFTNTFKRYTGMTPAAYRTFCAER